MEIARIAAQKHRVEAHIEEEEVGIESKSISDAKMRGAQKRLQAAHSYESLRRRAWLIKTNQNKTK